MPLPDYSIEDAGHVVGDIVFVGTEEDAARFMAENEPSCFGNECGPYDLWFVRTAEVFWRHQPDTKVPAIKECEDIPGDQMPGVREDNPWPQLPFGANSAHDTRLDENGNQVPACEEDCEEPACTVPYEGTAVSTVGVDDKPAMITPSFEDLNCDPGGGGGGGGGMECCVYWWDGAWRVSSDGCCTENYDPGCTAIVSGGQATVSALPGGSCACEGVYPESGEECNGNPVYKTS